MADAFQLGPLLLPAPLLIVLASVIVATIVARRLDHHDLDHRHRVDAEGLVWQGLLVGALVARVAFIAAHADIYRDNPGSILDIRDGGWQPLAGVLAVTLFTLWRAWKNRLQRQAAVIALATGLSVFGVGQAWLAWPAERQVVLASVPLARLDGQAVDLAGFAGKPTVVNLWATWCGPCQREMPVFERAQRQRPDVSFVFVSQGEAAGQVANWLNRQRLSLDNVLIDEAAQTSTTYGQKGYPTTLFFNAAGQLVTVRVGELSAATLAARLARISDGTPRNAEGG